MYHIFLDILYMSNIKEIQKIYIKEMWSVKRWYQFRTPKVRHQLVIQYSEYNRSSSLINYSVQTITVDSCTFDECKSHLRNIVAQMREQNPDDRYLSKAFEVAVWPEETKDD